MSCYARENAPGVPEVVVLPGDGVGPEIVAAARRVVDATLTSTSSASAICWVELDIGERCFARAGRPATDHDLQLLATSRWVLKGPMTNPGERYPSPNRLIRAAVGAWANVRFAVHPARRDALDVVLVRDITEDLGMGAQQWLGADAGVAIRTITRQASTKVSQLAFQIAGRRRARLVTVMHQAHLLPSTDGLFLASAQAVAAANPRTAFHDEAFDVGCERLIRRGGDYSVVLVPQFYGGILAGLCAGLIGGVGLMSGIIVGRGQQRMFEAAHGTAPSYVGQNRVNPTAMILAGALLLEDLGRRADARRIRTAVRQVYRAGGAALTFDQGGTASTSAFTDSVIAALTSVG
jgi:isocitrate dehydrogenase (NAD+)